MLFYVKVHKAYSALRGVRRACGQRLYGDMQHLLRFLRRAAKMENSIRRTGFYINISEFGGKNDEKTRFSGASGAGHALWRAADVGFRVIARQEAPKYAGAAFETAGQFAYIFALSDTAHVAISAPIISAYCVASVVWSRIFLKEKLSLKHYLMIALVVAGIVILGVYDG